MTISWKIPTLKFPAISVYNLGQEQYKADKQQKTLHFPVNDVNIIETSKHEHFSKWVNWIYVIICNSSSNVFGAAGLI